MATVEFRYDPKNTAWFTANAAMVLKAGEPAYHDTTGLFKLGDGVTALSALSFLPTVSASTPTIQQVLTAGQVATTTIETTGFIKTGGLSTQFLKADGTVDSTVYGVGNALTSNPLSQFAATTSSQLAGVISDETGSGALVFGTSPAFTTDITTPLIYGSSASGGNLTLQSTSNATKGKILFGTSAYDEVNNRLGLGTTSPAFDFDLTKSAATVSFNIKNTLATGFSYFETLGDDGVNYISLNTFNTNGGIGGLLANNTSWIIGDAANIGFINQKSTGILIFATGGVAAGNEKARFTTTHFLVNTTTAPGGLLSQMRVVKGTGLIDIGEYTAGRGAIWVNQATPTNANWALSADGSNNTFFNGGTSIRLLVSGNIMYSVFNNLVSFTDAVNESYGTTTGTKHGTSTSQKQSFWNATPIVQPTTAVAAATVVSGVGGNVKHDDTFDGYTVEKVVRALRNIGLLA